MHWLHIINSYSYFKPLMLGLSETKYRTKISQMQEHHKWVWDFCVRSLIEYRVVGGGAPKNFCLRNNKAFVENFS